MHPLSIATDVHLSHLNRWEHSWMCPYICSLMGFTCLLWLGLLIEQTRHTFLCLSLGCCRYGSFGIKGPPSHLGLESIYLICWLGFAWNLGLLVYGYCNDHGHIFALGRKHRDWTLLNERASSLCIMYLADHQKVIRGKTGHLLWVFAHYRKNRKGESNSLRVLLVVWRWGSWLSLPIDGQTWMIGDYN